MAIFTVEKLASLCHVDRETIRRWRNRGVNGVKLQSTSGEQQRGVGLLFRDDAVRAFVEANPKYLTRELNEILNGEPAVQPTAAAKAAPAAFDPLQPGGGYVRKLLEQQRAELLAKLQEVENALENLK